jgi:DNA-binding transcriptional MerR regulator
MQGVTYSISQLAQEFDVTTRTIRFYEDQGLLEPQRDGQRRIYTRRDRVRLMLILRGKRIGLSCWKSASCLICTMPPATTNRSCANSSASSAARNSNCRNSWTISA